MKIHILQHSNDVTPGSVPEWASRSNHAVEVRHLYRGDSVPDLRDVRMLIVCGGPMNVDDTGKHPWLVNEKKFLRAAIDSGKVCLGLCLGGQLLAQVLGGKVERFGVAAQTDDGSVNSSEKEIGWHTVHFEHKPDWSSQWPAGMPVFAWHEDRFTLPPFATRIATNSITPNQGFQFGDRIYGFQFHPEASESWVQDCASSKSFPAGTHVQDPKQIIAGLTHLEPMKTWFFTVLDELVAQAAHVQAKPIEF
jgi:GMP synthase-like glutamine amidotransferase